MDKIRKYWRKELGEQFRGQALEYIAEYINKIGSVTEGEGASYTSTFMISERMSTILPLGMSCNMTTMETCFVDSISVMGEVVRDKYGLERRVVSEVSLIDPQGNRIDTGEVCIDSLLFLLDCLDSFQNKDDEEK